ncbi:MAG: hypothetical protein KIT56_08295 [Gammaproteobacteria bacterium]|nr:hypothetical protein [Gammaproteobacteria bacterium]
MKNPFISIMLPSNRPKRLISFLDCLEETGFDHSSFEVLINLDVDDIEMSEILDREKKRRPFTIKYINTFSGNFYTLWKPLNDLLKIVNPHTYFLAFLSDEFVFETKGWDEQLRNFIGYYPDNIFRLRASQFRYRNYIDLWECGFSPECIGFYTKQWVDINGDWGPCFSPDAFQQCVSYYLFTSEPFLKEQYNREIPVPHLKFSGEGASVGLTGEKAKERARGGVPAWFTLMSHKMQTEAKRRAMLIKAHIIVASYSTNPLSIRDEKAQSKIVVYDTASKKISFHSRIN